MEKDSPVIIRTLTVLDEPFFTGGVRLLNKSQGEDLFEPTYLTKRVTDADSYVVGAIAEDRLVAIGVACIVDQFDYYLPFDDRIGETLAQRCVGSFATMCVDDSLRGQGIGQKLAHLRLEWLKEMGCHTVLGVSWVSGLGHTSDRVFEKMGFYAVKKVEQFYHKSSIEKPFYCPGCRAAPCTCSAILYRLDLSI